MDHIVDLICGTVLAIVVVLSWCTSFFDDVGEAIKEWAKSRKRIT